MIRWLVKIPVLVIAVTLLAAAVSAATLSDYRTRVGHARLAADELFEIVGAGRTESELNVIDQIGKLVPENERIETSYGPVDTANGWLQSAIAEFKDADKARQAAIATEIRERLMAIDEAAVELENAPATDQTKDADKQKLAAILARAEFQKAKPSEPSLFQKWWTDVVEWLAKMFPRPDMPDVVSWAGLRSVQFWIQIVVFGLVLGLVGFLVYKFAPFLNRRFGSATAREKKDRVILGERVAADESASNLFDEAERLARLGDLRGAIRKGYIALLCDLGDRNIVRLARHKTNRDYLRDVKKNPTLLENMTGLTRTFEANWYGLRTTNVSDWEEFRRGYNEAVAISRT